MREFHFLFLVHLVLGPAAIIIVAGDMNHPEGWDTWYRNPAYFFPYLVVLELFIWGTMAYVWRRRLKQERMAKGMWMLEEALRLQAQGRFAEAEATYHKGVALTGVSRNGG
jgi:hypothetical protein